MAGKANRLARQPTETMEARGGVHIDDGLHVALAQQAHVDDERANVFVSRFDFHDVCNPLSIFAFCIRYRASYIAARPLHRCSTWFVLEYPP